jgi:hypothetical protein
MNPLQDPQFIHQWDQGTAEGNTTLDSMIVAYRTIKQRHPEPIAILGMAHSLQHQAAGNTETLAQYLALAIARIGNALDTAETPPPKPE